MSIEKELQHFISKQIVLSAPGDGVKLDEPLLSSGSVDSMGLLQLLGYVDQQYGVDLLSSGNPKDFDTILALAAAIRRTRGDH